MIKKIENIAKIVLTDDTYNLLNKYLSNNDLDLARVLISDLLDDKENEYYHESSHEDDGSLLNEIQHLNTILDEIFNLYDNEDDNDRRKQIKSSS